MEVKRFRSPLRLVTATRVAGRRLVRPRRSRTERACALSGEHPVPEVVEVRESGRICVRVLGELDLAGAPILSERRGGGDSVLTAD